MRLLLKSAGISNKSISAALVSVLEKPIAESNALFVPTAIYGLTGSQGTRSGSLLFHRYNGN